MLRTWTGASAERQLRPASSSTTWVVESSLRRAATTQPALPPPTTTKSVSIDRITISLSCALVTNRQDVLARADQRVHEPLRLVEPGAEHRATGCTSSDSLADDGELEVGERSIPSDT